jgi:hypothetical protein
MIVSRNLVIVMLMVAAAMPQSTAAQEEAEFSLDNKFTYRGRLQHKGMPAEGRFDVTYELYDAREGGNLLGRIDRFDSEVHGGLLVADLDFGSDAFADGSPWLDIQVRAAETGHFTRLEPRQKIVGTGVCTVNSDVEINGDLTVTPGYQLRIGSALNGLRVDSNEITVSSLYDAELLINANGVGQVGIGVTDAEAPLNVVGGPDVTPTSGGALIVGSTAGDNLAIDQNEIMARDGGVPATLYLNPEGGQVQVGGPLDFGLEVVVQGGCTNEYITAVCPAGKRLLGGGCGPAEFVSPDVRKAYPSGGSASSPGGNTSYTCWFDGCDGRARAFAICANVR